MDSANKYDTVELFVKRLATGYNMYKVLIHVIKVQS